MDISSSHTALVAELCRWIDAQPEPPTLAALARQAGWSPGHLHRVFQAVTGITPKAYVSAQRARRMAQALAQGHSVTDAQHGAGYGSSSRLHADAPDRLGMPPSAYRAGGRGFAIRFALGQCSLGALLVAATERGLCAILLGDEPEPLLRDLQDRFPAAELRGAEPEFEQWMAQVVGLVDDPHRGLALPLDVRGTAFQQRVWQALRQIPPGRTASYTDIAHQLGQPSAVRAVAGACAANPLAVAIPCHRVVRQSGELSGYRWGLARKATLLEREAALLERGVARSGA